MQIMLCTPKVSDFWGAYHSAKVFFLFFFADYFGNHYSARAVMTTSNEVFIHDAPLRKGVKYSTSDEA